MTLKQYLKKYGISVYQFQRDAGLTHPFIYRYLKKQTKPSLENAKKIVKATGGEVKLEDI